MQICTDEKISIVLGGCSALLALLGFSVRCACCSDYLSQRDYSRFESSSLPSASRSASSTARYTSLAGTVCGPRATSTSLCATGHRQQSREQQVKQVRKSCCGRGRRSFRRDFHGKSEVHRKRVVGMMRAFGRDGRSGPIMVLS